MRDTVGDTRSAGVARPRIIRRRRHHRWVPRISAFYGIVIEMYFGDHAPPHFHARYSGDEATIVIATGEILDGSLPPRALRLVREWLSEHREELAENFELASDMQPVRPVAPLP